MDVANKTTAVVTGGLWLLGTINGTPISMLDFASATGLSIVGALSYQFFKAYAQREQDAAKGVEVGKRAQVDYLSLAYACLSAPLATGLLFWLIAVLGGTANSLYSIGGFYAAGALAPTVIPTILSRVLGLAGGKTP